VRWRGQPEEFLWTVPSSALEENRLRSLLRMGIWGERNQAAFFLASTSTSTPIISLSFMIRYSTPSDLDLGARPLAEQDAVADPDVDGDELAGLVVGRRVQWR